VTLGEGRGAPPMEGRGVAPMEGRGVSPGGRGVSPVTVPVPLGRGRSRGRQVSLLIIFSHATLHTCTTYAVRTAMLLEL
jgi:hypothetical protein